MIYFCCEEGRRSLVRKHPTINGIEYLEVVDSELARTALEPLRQRVLRVFFVEAAGLASLKARFPSNTAAKRIANAAKVTITGGERFAIMVDSAAWKTGTPYLAEHLEVRVTPRGDYSRYTLSLTEPNSQMPLGELDAQLASVDFSFKVECDTDFDCRPACDCPPPLASSPDLDYLTKDYASFRRLMLDRMSVVSPEWRERNPADLGVALVELLAYVGDNLSYRQDAIATEAYLGTARRRVSIRRHTRLLDYAMNDGCNARTWVQVRLASGTPDGVRLPMYPLFDAAGHFLRVETDLPVVRPDNNEYLQRPRFITRLGSATVISERDFRRLAGAAQVEVFEPLEQVSLFREHNEMVFHTWGDDSCCLPRGATKATLRGHFPNLAPGHLLVFAERIGPRTGASADADQAHRHAVRLSHVQATGVDPLYNPPVMVTEIEWEPADALPFPFCLSARAEKGGRLLTDVSVALGNIVPADHGQTLPVNEELQDVPSSDPALAPAATTTCGSCATRVRFTTPPRFRPRLKEAPLTHAAPFDASQPASAAFAWKIPDVLPSVHLADERGTVWRPKRDLLSSDAFAPEFVAEVENDGSTHLRFGDDENGMAPGEGTAFQAVYRIGNGGAGNVGGDALVQLVTNVLLDSVGVPLNAAGFIESVTNPLPARGARDPELMEEARQNAPAAFQIQQRAVTPEDYAAKAGEHPDVQRAAATLRWTGSWHTVFLTVDRRGGRRVDEAFEDELRDFLERYRLAGHDLEIDGPRFIPLELELQVCVAPNYFRNDVASALQSVFDNRDHTDGTRGFFHPDSFTFGQSVQLSRIYAAAQHVAGVSHVQVTLLRRQGATRGELVPASDVFETDRLEIVRLDNDPNFPNRGVLRINPVGGR